MEKQTSEMMKGGGGGAGVSTTPEHSSLELEVSDMASERNDMHLQQATGS